MKNKKDIIKWLNNLKSDIGQPQHSQLWQYTEILDVIARYLESTELKPKRPKGKWIDEDKFHHKYHICSECGLGRFNWGEDNYCPNCGAKMKGEEK